LGGCFWISEAQVVEKPAEVKKKPAERLDFKLASVLCVIRQCKLHCLMWLWLKCGNFSGFNYYRKKSASSGASEPKSKKRKLTKVKDPNMPKRPQTAYFLFL